MTQRADSVNFLEPVNRPDVRMIERCQQPCLARQARQTIRIVREVRWQHFDRNVPPQPRVARAVYLSHPAGAEQRLNLKDTEPPANEHRARRRRHRLAIVAISAPAASTASAHAGSVANAAISGQSAASPPEAAVGNVSRVDCRHFMQ
jgi:hypothetical protein